MVPGEAGSMTTRPDDGHDRGRPAFYALAPGGWQDYWSLLHPPYTLWHLSYVVIGACLAPVLHRGWLGRPSSRSSSRWGSPPTRSTN